MFALGRQARPDCNTAPRTAAGILLCQDLSLIHICFVWRETATREVARNAAFRDCLSALLLQFFLSAEAIVSGVALNQCLGRAAIKFHSISLEERPFVPLDAQPA